MKTFLECGDLSPLLPGPEEKAATSRSTPKGLLLLAVLIAGALAAQTSTDDVALQAMKVEMERSTAKLQLEQMQRPYFIEYRISDDDFYVAEAAFGAVRVERRSHQRQMRVVVRVGDYKQDSSVGPNDGATNLAPVENDVMAIRHQLWIATDQAYKAAIQLLTRKQAQLKQFESDQLPDDFSHEKPAQFIAPPARLEVDGARWRKALETATALYRSDPELQAFFGRVTFHVQTKYLMNSEGTTTRMPEAVYAVQLVGSEQAADGRRLERGYSRVVNNPAELPSAEELRTAAQQIIATLGDLRKAPLVEDEYRGPVLIGADAAGSVVARLIGGSVLGRRPRPGQTTRTIGDFASSWKVRVLPDFLDVTDDPTIDRYAGRTLLGGYKYDDEGVEGRIVKVIEHGTLTNYLIGGQPIRDFPSSNGHGRNSGPALGNLFLKSSAPVSFDELKKRLIAMCKDRGVPYGYYAESLGAGNRPEPLYRIYASDGHQELVRGGEFSQLDSRALRSNLIAAGDDLRVDNRGDGAPHSIIVPSLLFDELEIKKSATGREKLPDYPPPAIAKN